MPAFFIFYPGSKATTSPAKHGAHRAFAASRARPARPLTRLGIALASKRMPTRIRAPEIFFARGPK